MVLGYSQIWSMVFPAWLPTELAQKCEESLLFHLIHPETRPFWNLWKQILRFSGYLVKNRREPVWPSVASPCRCSQLRVFYSLKFLFLFPVILFFPVCLSLYGTSYIQLLWSLATLDSHIRYQPMIAYILIRMLTCCIQTQPMRYGRRSTHQSLRWGLPPPNLPISTFSAPGKKQFRAEKSQAFKEISKRTQHI